MDIFFELLNQIGFYLQGIAEVSILALLIYSMLYFLRGTRSIPILAGLTIIMLFITVFSHFFGLEVLTWIISRIWTVLALSVLVIFQPEFRRAFAVLGSQQGSLLQHSKLKREKKVLELLIESTFFLADRRIGALIALEQNIGLRAFAETGTFIKAPLSKELLSTIFFPNTPLHDGGVILKDGQIQSAGCIFPLTQSQELNKSLGTRHRAGVGLSEETDAIIIIVSEETGAVSLARKGRLIRGIDQERLRRHLTNYLVKKPLDMQKKKPSLVATIIPALEINNDDLGGGEA